MGKSQLFKDIVGRFLAAVAATLPPEAVEAAQARGRALDWCETDEGLLIALRELGWGGR